MCERYRVLKLSNTRNSLPRQAKCQRIKKSYMLGAWGFPYMLFWPKMLVGTTYANIHLSIHVDCHQVSHEPRKIRGGDRFRIGWAFKDGRPAECVAIPCHHHHQCTTTTRVQGRKEGDYLVCSCCTLSGHRRIYISTMHKIGQDSRLSQRDMVDVHYILSWDSSMITSVEAAQRLPFPART